MRLGLRLVLLALLIGAAAGFFFPEVVGFRLTNSELRLATKRVLDWTRLSNPDTRWSSQSQRRLERGGPRLQELLAEYDSTLIRWAAGDTLRVWIQRSGLVGGDARNIQLAEAALRDWIGIGMPLVLQRVDVVDSSNVRIRWVERLPDRRLGVTHVVFNDVLGMESAELRIALRDHRGHAVDADQLAAVLLHEAGHLLGLGHTADETSIMHPSSTAPRLSLSDRETVLLLYALPLGRVTVDH
ncbi:MAG: matrixin family metalloprotease [Longimicrobiales bacterium]